MREKIKDTKQIKERLFEDGDLRQGDIDEIFTFYTNDDLGFYQQGCEFLLQQLEKERSKLNAIREVYVGMTTNKQLCLHEEFPELFPVLTNVIKTCVEGDS